MLYALAKLGSPMVMLLKDSGGGGSVEWGTIWGAFTFLGGLRFLKARH